jgi:hypothetical protein
MKDVYKGSFLNVSALGGDNDGFGLFHDRQVSQVIPTVLRLQAGARGEFKTFLFDRDMKSGWKGSWSGEPLVSRAWVIQERLLAPRVLHYGARQLFWECRQQSACEIHPKAVYSDIDLDESALTEKHEHPHLWKQLLDAGPRNASQDPYDQLFEDWYALVDTYTKCELTFASDRLVALSGVAEDMRHALNTLRPGSHRYLAGIWEEKLAEGLCWSIRNCKARPKDYVAPSWSWASALGVAVVRHVYTKHALTEGQSEEVWYIEQCAATTVPLGDQDTGGLASGRLCFTGRWTQVRLSDVEEFGYEAPFISREIHHFEDPRTGQATTINRFRDTFWRSELDWAPVQFDALDEMPDLVFFVPIRGDGNRTGYSVYGLLLVRVHHLEEEIYRRVGLSEVVFEDPERALEFFGAFAMKDISVI